MTRPSWVRARPARPRRSAWPGTASTVLLVDRAVFPRAKVCGCCLNPRALGVLVGMGLTDASEIRGAHRLESLALAVRGRLAIVRHRLGVALSREVFDLALARAAAAAGADVVMGTMAQLLHAEDGERRPSAPSPTRARCGRGAGAVRGGRGGSIRSPAAPARARDRSVAANSKLGAGTIAPALAARLRAPPHPHGVAGATDMSGWSASRTAAWIVAAALRPEAVPLAGGLGALAGRILGRGGPAARTGDRDAPVERDAASSRMLRIAIAERSVFRVGDAAGYVEPFTGEGLAWALAGGMELANDLGGCPGRHRGHPCAGGGSPRTGAWSRTGRRFAE